MAILKIKIVLIIEIYLTMWLIVNFRSCSLFLLRVVVNSLYSCDLQLSSGDSGSDDTSQLGLIIGLTVGVFTALVFVIGELNEWILIKLILM